MDQQKCGVLGILLDKIVHDIFDSSSSDEDLDIQDVRDPDDDEPVLPKLRLGFPSSYFNEVPARQGVIDIFLSTCSHKEFKDHFRVSRATYEFILDFIKYDLAFRGSNSKKTSHHAVKMPLELQLLLAFRKICSTDTYRQLCGTFGVRKEVVKKVVQRVTQSLFDRSSKFISWPHHKKLQAVCQGFQASSKIPNIVGALDSALVSISGQHLLDEDSDADETPQSYSVQLQLVADHEGRVTFCSAGALGKTERQAAFDDSLLKMFLSKSEERFPGGSHLVASSDYELHENIMVPYNDANLTAAQKSFNEHLKLAHNAVTKTIAAFKTRFPSLTSSLQVERADLVEVYFIACAVLYNICLERNDLLDDPPHFVNQEFDKDLPGTLSVASSEALQKRDSLCKQLERSIRKGVCFV